MRDVIARWGERFVRRLFTEIEIAYCRSRRDPVPHFAARFAAKEAAMKALGTGLSLGVRWRDLEVRRERGQARGCSCTDDRARSGSRAAAARCWWR
jgi:holo-[acyl-carrier protein] synthase